MVDAFRHLGHVDGFPVHPASKESRYRLPVRRDRRRALHLADVR